MGNPAPESDNTLTPPSNEAPPPPFAASTYQAGAHEMGNIHNNATSTADEVLPNAENLLPNGSMPGGHEDNNSWITSPERMKHVEENSATVDTIPEIKDDQNLKNAAYRYLMNQERVDDYSRVMPADTAALEAAGVKHKLDDILKKRHPEGLNPYVNTF